MTRFSLYTALAAVTVLALASNADARTHRVPAAQDRAAAFAAAHNGVTDETNILQQCAANAAKKWGTTNQDMQTNRDFRYRTCAFDHGVRNP
jgi:hypothetical protein